MWYNILYEKCLSASHMITTENMQYFLESYYRIHAIIPIIAVYQIQGGITMNNQLSDKG